MSDDLTPRDVIARAVNDAESLNCVEWTPQRVTDAVLAELDAAGWSITRQPDEWEWARQAPFDWTDVTEWGDGPEAQGNAEADYEENGGAVLRRRPAGPWEVAP